MAGAPYIVWSPEGEAPPKVSFDTHPQACLAMHHMAAKHPGKQFYVMARSGKGAKVKAEQTEEAA